MRVTGITGAKPANFEQLRGVILHDWKDAIASEQRSAAVHALVTLVDDDPDPKVRATALTALATLGGPPTAAAARAPPSRTRSRARTPGPAHPEAAR